MRPADRYGQRDGKATECRGVNGLVYLNIVDYVTCENLVVGVSRSYAKGDIGSGAAGTGSGGGGARYRFRETFVANDNIVGDVVCAADLSLVLVVRYGNGCG